MNKYWEFLLLKYIYFFFLLIEVLDQRSSEITGLDNSHTLKIYNKQYRTAETNNVRNKSILQN